MKTLYEKVDTSALTLLALRIAIGVVVLGHGAQKLFGWFGGYGFDATMNFFTQQIGLPYPVAFLTIVAETAGMILLILGIYGRYLAATVILIMIGAIVTVHGQNGFFMNWDGALAGEGYEFHLLALGIAFAITVNGTGAYSLDRYLFRKKTHVIPDNYSARQ